MFMGFVAGYSISSDINYCPECGAMISVYHADGTATCTDCGYRFGVVAVDGEDDEEGE